MAVLPQFEPAAPATEPAKNVQSWMNQAQERQMRGQQMQENQMRLNVMGPVIQAKAQADLATAVSDIATAKSNLDQTTFKAGQRARYAQSQLSISQELDGIIAGADTPAQEAAPELPEGASPQEVIAYRKEQAQADRDHTRAALEQQEAALSRWMAKYNWINDTPDGANLFKMADSARGRIFQTRLNENITDRILEKTGMEQAGKQTVEEIKGGKPQSTIGKLQGDMKRAQAEGRTEDVASLQADIDKQTKAARPPAIMQLIESLHQSEDAGAPQEDLDAIRGVIARQVGGTKKVYQLESYRQQRDDALEAGNEFDAERYQAAMDKIAFGSGMLPSTPAMPAKKPAKPAAGPGPSIKVSTTPGEPSKYTAPSEVVAEIKSGKITREQGLQILRDQFGMQ
jgi:hypothetical protein